MTHNTRKLYVSTGTMVGRSNNYDYKRALYEIGQLTAHGFCDGLELMMLKFYYDKIPSVAEAVRQTAVAAVIHCEKEIGTMISDAGVLAAEGKSSEADALYAEAYALYRKNCRMGELIGVNRMVLHLWGGISSDRHIEYNKSKLSELAETAAEYGIRLLIENIPSNSADPLTNWHSLLPLPENAAFIFDTRFGKLHEQTNEILTDSEITPFIEHIHISDFGGEYRDFSALRPILHPGEGKINFKTVADLLDEIEYTGTITLESPIMTAEMLDIPKIKTTLSYINQIF